MLFIKDLQLQAIDRGKKLAINKVCSFINLWNKSPNLSVFVFFCHLPKLEASFLTFFLHELVHVAIHFYWQINTSFDFEGTVLRRQ